MNTGLRKGLEDIAWELKGIKNILSSMWHSRYEKGIYKYGRMLS